MDITIDVNFKQSEINGLFNEIEELKRQRVHLKEAIDKKTATIIHHIKQSGNVLAYKNNEPYVLMVKMRTTKKFDKSSLATDTDRTSSELNLIGIAELVETQKTSSEQLKKYQFEE